MAGLLDTLGKTTAPLLFARLQAIGAMDTMNILRDTLAADSRGRQARTGSAATNASPIPCSYAPKIQRAAFNWKMAEKIESVKQYIITAPTSQNGAPIDIKTGDRIQVLARGIQLEKIFSVLGAGNASGILMTIDCELQDKV